MLATSSLPCSSVRIHPRFVSGMRASGNDHGISPDEDEEKVLALYLLVGGSRDPLGQSHMTHVAHSLESILVIFVWGGVVVANLGVYQVCCRFESDPITGLRFAL